MSAPDPPTLPPQPAGRLQTLLRTLAAFTHVLPYVAFALAVFVALYLGGTWGSEETAEALSSAPGRSLAWCTDENGHPHATAIAHCHRVDELATEEWLRAERLRNREEVMTKANCRNDWVNKRCIAVPAAQLEIVDFDYYSKDATWRAVLRALSRVPAAWRTEWHAAPSHVLVDYRGGVWLRVVAFHEGAFQPVLLDVGALIDTLDAWQLGIDDTLAGEAGQLVACVCPQHLGILASRLFFRYDAESGWRVLTGAALRTRTREASQEVRSKYNYSAVLHAFPLIADAALLSTRANRTYIYTPVGTLTAYDPTELADRQRVEHLDRAMKREWDTDGPYMAMLPTGPPNVDAVRVEPRESDCFARCDRLDARMQELTPPPPPVLVEERPPTEVATGQPEEEAPAASAPPKKPGRSRPSKN